MGRAVRHPRGDTRRSISIGKHGNWRRPHQSLECRTAATLLHIGSFLLLSTWLLSHTTAIAALTIAIAALCKHLPSWHSVTIAIAALGNKISQTHIFVTHTCYLRPTGQSKDYFLQLLLHSKQTWGLRPHMEYQHTNLVFSATLESTPPFGYLSAYISYYKFGNT